nr:glycosyltransferase family 2 protein [Limnohabitans sp. 2KL-17]
MTQTIIPAANARNLGALEAVGEFLFFLDDDALLIAEPQEFCRLIEELTPQLAAAVCHRGELIDGTYLSHWPTGVTRITVQNFSAFCIEWNFIVRRELFFSSGAFPEIGTGSQHAALSGEIFVLAARLLGCGHSLNTINFIRVAHPSLLKPRNTATNLLGYYYGSGYAVGISFNYFSLWAKIYWITRVAVAAIFDSTHRYRTYKDCIKPELAGLRVKLSRARLVGFADGLFGREVKQHNWLSSMVANGKKL